MAIITAIPTIIKFVLLSWLFSFSNAFLAQQQSTTRGRQRCIDPLYMSTAPGTELPPAIQIKMALSKASKTLSVGMDYVADDAMKMLSPTELSILSMQLRKSKVSAIWTNQVLAVSMKSYLQLESHQNAHWSNQSNRKI